MSGGLTNKSQDATSPGEEYHRRHRIVQAVYGNNRKHIPKTYLENQRHMEEGDYPSHLRFTDDVLVCANTLQEPATNVAEGSG